MTQLPHLRKEGRGQPPCGSQTGWHPRACAESLLRAPVSTHQAAQPQRPQEVPPTPQGPGAHSWQISSLHLLRLRNLGEKASWMALIKVAYLKEQWGICGARAVSCNDTNSLLTHPTTEPLGQVQTQVRQSPLSPEGLRGSSGFSLPHSQVLGASRIPRSTQVLTRSELSQTQE